MKKFICAIMLCFILFYATGCQMFSSVKNNVSSIGNSYEVSVIYDKNITEKYTFYEKKQAVIEPKFYAEKNFLGIYETSEATGTKYVDASGKVLLWDKNYPTTLYAVYEDFDYSLIYTSEVSRDENPINIRETWLTDHGEETFEYLNFHDDNITQTTSKAKIEFSQILKQHPEKNILLTIHFNAKGGFSNSFSSDVLYARLYLGDDKVIDKSFSYSNVASESFNKFNAKATSPINAKQLYNNKSKIKLILIVSTKEIAAYSCTVKNIYYTIEFVK